MHPIIEEDIKNIISEIQNDIHKLEGRNILITGASGMLPSYLVYTLIYLNKHLFKKPVKLYLMIRNNKKFGRDKNVHYVKTDISKKSPKIKNIHYVIHAASKAAPKLYIDNMIDTLNTNILGLYNILKICDKNLKSMLFFSAGEIYGTTDGIDPVDEKYIGPTDHLNKRSCYVEAKRACETICMNYFWEQNLPVKIVRIFHTFGPGLNLNDGRVFSDFVKFGLEKKDICILGDKNLRRAFLYIKDATIMFLKILLSDKNGEVYNISSDQNIISVNTLAKIVCKSFNKRYAKKLKVVEHNKKIDYYKHAAKAIIPNVNKFKRDFLYVPSTNIEEMVSRTIDFYLK